eukprot:364639-Chlamydomonas_euryale.AAC.42
MPYFEGRSFGVLGDRMVRFWQEGYHWNVDHGTTLYLRKSRIRGFQKIQNPPQNDTEYGRAHACNYASQGNLFESSKGFLLMALLIRLSQDVLILLG